MSRFNTPIDATGCNGNIFAILGRATYALKILRVSKAERDRLAENVMSSHSYEQAIKYIEEYFPVIREEEHS